MSVVQYFYSSCQNSIIEISIFTGQEIRTRAPRTFPVGYLGTLLQAYLAASDFSALYTCTIHDLTHRPSSLLAMIKRKPQVNVTGSNYSTRVVTSSVGYPGKNTNRNSFYLISTSSRASWITFMHNLHAPCPGLANPCHI